MEKWEKFSEEEIKEFLQLSKTKKQFAEFLGYVTIHKNTWINIKNAFPEINFEIFNSGLQDLTGKKFGRLTVLERDLSVKNRTKWFCKCDCGTVLSYSIDGYDLKTGHTKSCGCYAKEKRKERADDLSGQTFGRWTVLERDNSSDNKVKWICQCSCELKTIKSVLADKLKSGESKSCGCLKSDLFCVDISGERFGKLTALKRIPKKSSNHSAVWLCKCDCGTFKEVSYHDLKGNYTKSCGCLKSKGELKIEESLKKLGLSYICQYKIDDLKTTSGKHYPFDFAVFIDENIVLIEYNGIQHYNVVEHFGGEEEFYKRQNNDSIKALYCKENNIPLIIIPYWDYDIIDEEYINKLIKTQLKTKIK